MQDEAGGNLDEEVWNVIVSEADSEPKDEKLTLDEYKAWMEKNRSPIDYDSNDRSFAVRSYSLQTMGLSSIVTVAMVCTLR